MHTPFDSSFDLPGRPRVLFEDYYLLVVQKPFGYTVEQHHHYPSLETFAQEHLRQLYPQHKKHFTGIVHRLDVVTAGLVVLAKTPQALKHLNKQFEDKTALKAYRACVNGIFSRSSGCLDGFITEDKKNRQSVFTTLQVAGAKKSVLTYTVTEEKNGFSLVDILLDTGRFHQIRASLAYLGLPIVNDEKYGAKKISSENKIWLCAQRLEITHPKTGERMVFSVEPNQQ